MIGAQGERAGDTSSQRSGHTSLGGRGVLPRRWSVLKAGVRGVAVSNGPSTPALGDGELCPGGGWCSRGACGGHQLPTARAHQPRGTGKPVQAVVCAQGRRAGGSGSQRPGRTGLGGRGVVPRRWLVLKGSVRGTLAPNGPGTPASGDGESCPGGGLCSRRACGG